MGVAEPDLLAIAKVFELITNNLKVGIAMDQAEQRLDTRLQLYRLEKRPTSTLGDCMFDAISDQLLLHKGITTSAKAVRGAIVQWLRNNAGVHFGGAPLHALLDPGEEWDTYCTTMSNITWGDLICLVAATHLYNTQIVLWSSFPGDQFVSYLSEEEKPHSFLLGYLDDWHYISLGRIGGIVITT